MYPTNSFIFKNSTEAWEQMNEMFIRHDARLFENGFKLTNSSFAYDLSLIIEKPELDPEFNFGSYFLYTMGKWSKLVMNYLDLDNLDETKEQIREMEKEKLVNRYYNVGFQFVDKHDNGKGCLLAGIFSRVLNDPKPVLTIILRACEVTTRLPFDLLFFQRIGEYIYGNNEFTLKIFIKQAFADDNILLMYNSHRKIKRVLKDNPDTTRTETILKVLNKMISGTEEEFSKYQVHFRSYKALHPEAYQDKLKLKILKAKDCIIGEWDGIPLPKPCPDIIERDRIKKDFLKFTERNGIQFKSFKVENKKRKIVKV